MLDTVAMLCVPGCRAIKAKQQTKADDAARAAAAAAVAAAAAAGDGADSAGDDSDADAADYERRPRASEKQQKGPSTQVTPADGLRVGSWHSVQQMGL
jgi:hypothetical protein